MPSTNQAGNDSGEYSTEAERMIATKPKDLLLNIRPMTEEAARGWLGASNQHGDRELVEHYAEQVRRLKGEP